MNTIQADLAYIAGIIDGEGCISIKKTKPSGRYKSIRHTLYVSVEMTDYDVLKFIAKYFPKPIRERHRGDKRKTIYVMTWSSELAVAVIEKLLPFLISKKNQAHLALKFQKNIHKYTLTSGDGWRPRLTNDELFKREKFYQLMHSLKNSYPMSILAAD